MEKIIKSLKEHILQSEKIVVLVDSFINDMIRQFEELKEILNKYK